ncbi:MAG: hypothetical protein E7490_05005 [Ruminococcaceae bacterium]|nr:hypothetical protein [Oscillospiraceae bacterium]
MLNVLRSDIYRLFHRKTLFIMLGCTVGFALFVGLLGSSGNISTESIITSIGSLLPLICATITTSAIVTAEYKNGYIKNTVSVTGSRLHIYFSKLITSAIVLIFAILSFLDIYLLAVIINPKAELLVQNLDMLSVFAYLGFQFLSGMSIISIVLLIAMLSRSNALGCLTAFAICMGIVNSSVNALSYLLKEKEIIPNNVELTDYLVTNYTTQINFYSAADFVTKGVIVSLVYLVISVALSMLVIKKRDI